MKLYDFYKWTSLIFYEFLTNRIPNDEQTACLPCPNNVVANVIIGECRCPGDLVFEDEDWDNCEYLHIFIQIDLL